MFLSTPASHLNPSQWNYNQAAIDASQIVWAADLGPQKNEELLHYYPDRKPWRVYGDINGYILLPYEQPFPDLRPRLELLDAQFGKAEGEEGESAGRAPAP